MTDKKAEAPREQLQSAPRKPYETPAVLESTAFETLALAACISGGCGTNNPTRSH